MSHRLLKRRKLEHDFSLDIETACATSEGIESIKDHAADNSSASWSKKERSAKRRMHDMATDGLTFHSSDAHMASLFKLQADEMLKTLKYSHDKTHASVDDVLHQLKSTIESIPDREPLPINDAIDLMYKKLRIVVPFPEPQPDLKASYKLSYTKPSNINVVGSYVMNTMSKNDDLMAVDMIVCMPASIFQEKDYLNYRYFYKRAYYLASIAAALKLEFGSKYDLVLEYLHGNTLQPILALKPGTGSNLDGLLKSKCYIRIIPAAPESIFPRHKLLPFKNAIRPKGVLANEDRVLQPTPFYNATLQADTLQSNYLRLLHDISKQATGYTDFCILGRIWLQQRGLGSSVSQGGFGHFEWAALSAIFLQRDHWRDQNVLSPSYSSHQLFKAMIQYLATHDLVSTPIFFLADASEFHKSEFPMFFDGPRSHNILYKMTPWSLRLLREEAVITLEMLNDTVNDNFTSTFITKKDNGMVQFDGLLTIHVPIEQLKVNNEGDHKTTHFTISSIIYKCLREGLGDRVTMIYLQIPPTPPWQVISHPPQLKTVEVTAGFCFDAANIGRSIDYGPTAEDKGKAATYRQFWGDKAELRRFKNGDILESVIWLGTSEAEIFREIVLFTLKRHVSQHVNVKFTGNGFNHILSPLESTRKTFSSIREAVANFESDLRSLEGMPLQLKEFASISPHSRYTSLETPGTNRTSAFAEELVEIVVSFEGSGRWPDDLSAIHRMKIALLLKISGLLEDFVDGVRSEVGVENSDNNLLNSSFLDVCYPSGMIFRLRINNEREALLLERQSKDKADERYHRATAAAALSQYNRTFIQLPRHTQSVITMSTRFPALSSTIRLAKKWFACHMLLQHFREEFIELLVIHSFAHPHPWRPPSNPLTGFLRTLYFIARWDWRSTPLIVDFNGSISRKEVASLYIKVEAWRKIDPAMNQTVLLAPTNHDMSGMVFTSGFPSKVVAIRMTALARSACEVIKHEGPALTPSILFTARDNVYDFIIHLAPPASKLFKPDGDKLSSQVAPRLMSQGIAKASCPTERPIFQYLEELKSRYTTSVIFFCRHSDHPIICGLWDPHTRSQPFKISLAHGTKPLPKGAGNDEEMRQYVEIDKGAILSEMARLGGDLVTRIEINQ